MTWFKVDDSFYDHPKIMGVSLAARGLWVTCASYGAKHLTNGRMSDLLVVTVGGPDAVELAAELVDAGLWHRVDGGVQFHDWDEYQPSRESVLAERAAARERQRKAREAARAKRDFDGIHADRNGVGHTVSHAVTSGEVTEDVTAMSQPQSRSPRPDPTRPVVPTGTKTARARKRAAPIPDDFAVSPQMIDWQRTQGISDEDARRETTKFINNATAKGVTYVDWTAAWRNWLLNAISYGHVRAVPNGTNGAALDVDAVLGHENFPLPSPPDGIEAGTPEYRTWAHAAKTEWQNNRERRAREILKRREAS